MFWTTIYWPVKPQWIDVIEHLLAVKSPVKCVYYSQIAIVQEQSSYIHTKVHSIQTSDSSKQWTLIEVQETLCFKCKEVGKRQSNNEVSHKCVKSSHILHPKSFYHAIQHSCAGL